MSSVNPTVTIIIPTFNRAPFLETCLRHISAQTFTAYETLVIDDGSTDETPKLLTQMQAKYPQLQLRWYRREQNRGSNRARNLGIKKARGEYIAFLDSDSYPESDWLEKILSAFSDDDPRVASATGRFANVEPRTVYELAYKGSSLIRPVGAKNAAPRITSGNLILRRRVAQKFLFDEDFNYGCDEEGLYYRLKAAGYRQLVVPDAVVLHDHPYDRNGYFRRARILGRGAARLVYKYKLLPRVDLLPFITGYALLPAALIDVRLLIVSMTMFGLGFAALIYNELFRKQKTLLETGLCIPLVLAYYQVRVFSYVKESIRLRFFPNEIERVDLRALRQHHACVPAQTDSGCTSD